MAIQLPKKPKVVSEEGNSASFEIAPLYPGYGITIGNSLRRVLLSSLPGVAITSVKIEGVSHEFSSISGVFEDVMDIVMNLKKVRIKLFDGDSFTASIKVKGEKDVKAGDIVVPSNVEIANPNQHIATVNDKKGELNMELVIEKGVGYVPVDQKNKDKLSVGMITIDALYSPVEFVNYDVENIRVGERTDYNKILIEIRTDGTITPNMALAQASDILINHFEVTAGKDNDEKEIDGSLKDSEMKDEVEEKKELANENNIEE